MKGVNFTNFLIKGNEQIGDRIDCVCSKAGVDKEFIGSASVIDKDNDHITCRLITHNQDTYFVRRESNFDKDDHFIGIELFVLDAIKSKYFHSDVTSGEFIYNLCFDPAYTELAIVSAVQRFLDWDESPEKDWKVVKYDLYKRIERV